MARYKTFRFGSQTLFNGNANKQQLYCWKNIAFILRKSVVEANRMRIFAIREPIWSQFTTNSGINCKYMVKKR